MRNWLREHSTEIKLFFTIWLVYAVYVTPAGGVTPNRYVDLVHSIVNEGRFEIDTYHENTIDKAYYDGHYYAGALPGPSFLAVPAYVVFKGMYTLVPDVLKEMAGGIQSYKTNKLPESSFYGQVDNVEFFLSQAFLVVSTVAFFAALAGVFFYNTLKLMDVEDIVAFPLTFVFAFGTTLFWNATWFFEQAFTIFFALVAFYTIFRMRLAQFSTTGLISGGFLAGCALLIEFSGAFVGLTLFLYVLMNYKKPKTLFYWLGFSIPVMILMFYNYSLFGNPFSTPYQHLIGTEFQAIIEEGFVGVSYPRLDRFVGLLISPERGVLVFVPSTILGFAGLLIPSRLKSKHKNEAILFSALAMTALLFVSSFKGWNAGGAFGPRYLMFGLPFMVIPVAFFVDNKKDRLQIAFFIGFLSILINWAGAQYGFAENYYQHLENVMMKGPTLPIFEAIASHAVVSHPFFEFITCHKSLLFGMTNLVLLGGIGALWLLPQFKKSLMRREI
ncbi:MAG: hypothetical protein ISR58_05870 [Anaerolineales bacterium]|nr:hypothetical protein [Chloroflexota bacterium]MBL6980703.1 hypothetical protein [Anaerolineales bacterium]